MSWGAVVVGKGMWDVTQRMLDTLLETTQPRQIDEIVYIDNGGPEHDATWAAALDWKKHTESRAVVIGCLSAGYPPLSLSDAWNIGVRSLTNDLVLICNNDLVFHGPGWLDEFERSLGDPACGVTGTIGMSWKDTPFIQGSLFGFTRKIWKEVGEFDPRFLFTCEEVDWCKRLQLLGYKIQSHEHLDRRNGGPIEHLEGATRNHYPDSVKEYQRLAHISRLEFCYKWTYPDIHIHD